MERKNCIITNDSNRENLFTLKSFPVFMGCTSEPEEKDVKADMEWDIYKESGVIQLRKPLPLSVVYSEFHNSGAIGNIWEEHHKNFAEFISKYSFTNIFEIGGGHGRLSTYYNSLIEAEWTILEPNPSPIKGVKAKFIKGFFDHNFNDPNRYDVIIHSHVFEHIYDPTKFVERLSSYMKIGQKLIFSIPNIQEMIKRNYTNALNFEHTFLLNEGVIEFLMNKYGFYFIEKKYFKDDHSIFFTFELKSKINQNINFKNQYNNNRKIFKRFIKYQISIVDEINKSISFSNEPVFLFGAHIFSQYLIANGLSTTNIICIIDNDKTKQNKRLYGTKLFVKSPNILSKHSKPIVILKAGIYNDEIKNDILKNINRDAIFI